MLKRAPHWTNQPLVVYHGTLDLHVSSILAGIDLDMADNDSDFGRGFYTTTRLDQALVFAQTSKRLSDIGGVKPAVVKFTVDRDVLAQLESLWFVRHSSNADDFWNLVGSCRRLGTSNRDGDSWYDVVVGPVARWYQTRRAWNDYDQISFHTDKAVKILDNTPKGVI